jgi:hypothetical protein
LYAFGSFSEGPGEGGVCGYVLEEGFPLDFEGVVIGGGVWYFLPAAEEVYGLLYVWVPGGAGCGACGLDPAFAQAYYGAAVGARRTRTVQEELNWQMMPLSVWRVA